MVPRMTSEEQEFQSKHHQPNQHLLVSIPIAYSSVLISRLCPEASYPDVICNFIHSLQASAVIAPKNTP